MPGFRDFFNDHVREWSRRKHEVLSGYVKPFTQILGKYFGPVYVIDGFAGRGYYGTGADKKDGSPLRIAKLAREPVSRELRCVNVELRRAEFANLEEATAPYPDIVENIRGAFADHVDAILEKIDGAPTLFFIDPFGFRGLTWDTIAKLGNRDPAFKTELLINFFAPTFHRDARLAGAENKLSPAFEKRLNLIMGHDEWKPIWEDASLDYEERCARVTDLFCRGLERFGFIASKYPIREHIYGRLKYYLIHATRHPLGRQIMSEVFYGVNTKYLRLRAEHLDEERLADTMQPALVGMETLVNAPAVEELEKPLVDALTKDVEAIIRERHELTFLELHDALIVKWFGVLIEKHYKQVCRELQGDGKIDYEGGRLPNDESVIRHIKG